MGFAFGLRCFSKGAQLAFSPLSRKFIIVPASISLIIVVSGLALAFTFISDFSAYMASLGVWPGMLDWLLEPLLYLFGVLLGTWLFGFIAVIVGAPFYSALNAQIHPITDNTPPRAWYTQIAPTLLREYSKARYTLPRLTGLLLIGFVPIVNLLTPLLWLGYGGWLMAVQFCDFSFEHRDQPFAQTLKSLRACRSTCIGFGALTTLGMALPLINFIVAPIAVAGAALLVKKIQRIEA